MNTTPIYGFPQYIDADSANLEALNAPLLAIENDLAATKTSSAAKATVGQALVMALIFGG